MRKALEEIVALQGYIVEGHTVANRAIEIARAALDAHSRADALMARSDDVLGELLEREQARAKELEAASTFWKSEHDRINGMYFDRWQDLKTVEARWRELREAVLWAYQLAGAVGEPVEHLDNLSALSRDDPAPYKWGVAGVAHLALQARLAEIRKLAEPVRSSLRAPVYHGDMLALMLHVQDLLAAIYREPEGK